MKLIYDLLRTISYVWEPPTIVERLKREIADARLAVIEERKRRDYCQSMLEFEELRLRTMRAELAREMRAAK